MTNLLQEKNLMTGEATGDTSFAKVFAAITGLCGNVLILATIGTAMIHEPARIPLSQGLKYGSLLVAFGLLIYSGKVAGLLASIVRSRYGGD